MRRIPAIITSVLMLFSLSACGKGSSAVDYLSIPFSSEARIVIDSSEYLVHIEKGGADLVSVVVGYPEDIRGMSVLLGEESGVSVRNAKILQGFPRSVAQLIYDAFEPSYITETFSDGDAEIVRFTSPHGGGNIRIDGFSCVPISLDSEGIHIEFTDFKR